MNIGSNQLNCMVPLCLGDRYFISHKTETPSFSVAIRIGDKTIFEIIRNEPQDNPITLASKTPPGIVTVADKRTNRFIYKIRPGFETSIVFGKIKGEGEIEVVINDHGIFFNGNRISDNTVSGYEVGVTITADGQGFSLGDQSPDWLRPLLNMQ